MNMIEKKLLRATRVSLFECLTPLSEFLLYNIKFVFLLFFFLLIASHNLDLNEYIMNNTFDQYEY